MTQAMPRTKPNIMITARLLLMPVLRSVELKPVLCASAGRALRARMPAAMSRAGSRERILRVTGLSGWMIFILFVFGGSDSFAADGMHSRRNKKWAGSVGHKVRGKSV